MDERWARALRAKGIDIGLNNNIGNRNNGVLQSGGNTHRQNLTQHTRIKRNFMPVYPVWRIQS